MNNLSLLTQDVKYEKEMAMSNMRFVERLFTQHPEIVRYLTRDKSNDKK